MQALDTLSSEVFSIPKALRALEIRIEEQISHHTMEKAAKLLNQL
jgi:hypothetical protein